MHILVPAIAAVTPLLLLTAVSAYPSFDENELYTRNAAELDDIWTRDAISLDEVDSFELLARSQFNLADDPEFMDPKKL